MTSAQLSLMSVAPHRLEAKRGVPPVLSFFSGAGFLDLGLIQAGFQVAWSLEFEPRICAAHDYGMKSFFKGAGQRERSAPQIGDPKDIRLWGPNAILRQASGSLAGRDDFGIVGGPPCPDFSVGGK